MCWLLRFFVFIVNDWIFVARRMSTKDYTLQSNDVEGDDKNARVMTMAMMTME